MKTMKKICWLAGYLFFVSPAFSQKLFFRQFTVDDGLPSNEVYQVLQDDDGNLLAATDRGVVKFDGYNFQSVSFNNSVITTPVYYIYKSIKGNIFFSGPQGHLFLYRNNKMQDYRYNSKIKSFYTHSGLLIANSLSEKGDSLWISYNNDYNYNFKIGSLIVHPSGDVTEVSQEDGIYFDLKNKFYYRLLTSLKSSYHDTVHITWPDGTQSKDKIFLSWQGGYIRRLYYEKFHNYDIFCIGRRLLIYENQKKISEKLFDTHILYMTVIKDKLYLGFDTHGVSVYNIDKGRLIPEIKYLDGLTVTSIYRDNQDGTWFSTHDNGLFYSYPSKAIIKEVEKIHQIEKRKDLVYIGHRSGVIEIYKNGKLVRDTKIPGASFLLGYSFDINDSLFAVSSKGNHHKKNGTWHYYPGLEQRIIQLSPQLVYGAAFSFPELYKFDRIGGKILKKYLLPKRVISMAAGNENKLWLGTWEGLYVLQNDSLKDLRNQNKVFNDRIVGINKINDGELVVASLNNGLAIIKGGKTYVFNQTNGQLSPVINSMVIDRNDIWLGTNKGLTKVKFTNGSFQFQHFGIESGLPTIDINTFTVNENFIYLKWQNNLTLIKVNELENRAFPDKTTITSVVARGKQIKATNAILSHEDNDVEFHFNAINLAAARDQQYRYQLAGFDNGWQTTKERSVKYTNLPPGHYTFKVQAFTNYWDTASATDSFFFSVTPAFWQRWWFYPMLMLTVLVFLLIAFMIRLRNIKTKNQMVLELSESRQKALVHQINPHFIYNILNTIQGAVLKEDKMTAASIIARFGKLMRMSMDMGNQKVVSLEKEIELLLKYFELESMRSPGKFEYDISVHPNIDPGSLKIPSMLIQPFVENSIKHGIMHLDSKGKISINFSKGDEILYCIVEDNGIGREASKKINQKLKPEHKSSGLEITINRLKLLHKEKGTNYYFETTDKLNELGHVAGTIIKFSIPFNQDHE